MAEKVVRLFGPWAGINEWPAECGLNEFEDAWNVDFEGDVVRTRRGRLKLIEDGAWNVYPKSVYREIGTQAAGITSRADGTAVLTDGDSTTTFDIAGLGIIGGGAGDIDQLYVGFASPVASVYVEVGTANSAATTLAVEVWTQAGWVAIGALVDGTTGFHQSGLITGTVTLTAWKSSFLNGRRLYWARVSATGANVSAGTTITGVYSPMTTANGLLNGINGIYHWKRRTGERFTIIGMDSPSMSIARLFVYDWAKNKLSQMSMGATGSGPDGGGFGPEEQTGPDAHWRFDVLDGNLLAANGYLFLHSDPKDAFSLVPFERAGLVSGSTYTQDVPSSAKYVRVYQGCVYIVTREHPGRVRRSEPVGANGDLMSGTTAPLGGANIWNATSWWTASDRMGGDVTGLELAGGNLLVFTPNSVSAFNGVAQATVDSDVGCIAPNTLSAARGTVFFLGAEGVYATSGGQAKLISWKVTPTLRGLNRMSLPGAVGIVQPSRNRYRLYLPSGNTKQNDLVLVYDYEKQAWTKYGNPGFASMNPAMIDYKVKAAVVAGDDEWLETVLEVDYDGAVWVADEGRTDNGSGITSLVVSKRIKMDDESLVTIRGIRVQIETAANGNINVAALRDGTSWKRSANLGASYRVGNEQVVSMLDGETTATYEVFGTARIGTDTWRSPKIMTAGVSLGANAGTGAAEGLTARYFQFVLHNSIASAYGTPLVFRGLEADVLTRKGTR